jgi:hypothetical protein
LFYGSKELLIPLQSADFIVNTLFKDLTIGGSGDAANALVRGEINKLLKEILIEPPVRFDDVALRAMATGDYSEITNRPEYLG